MRDPENDSSSESPAQAVAIIGMAGRFPGAPDVPSLWRNIVAGTESLRHFPPQELAPSVPESLRQDPHYVPVRGYLDEAACFDAAFFGVAPREAALMDPQQRVFLECCWHALEDGACLTRRQELQTGVFAGQNTPTYLLANLCQDRAFIERLTAVHPVGDPALLFGNDADFLATRVAHRLGLRGPAVTVQTACSTSLVAVVQAVNSLLAHQCDLCLAGGVSISFPQERGHRHEEGAIVSADGHCRPFDASASGTVFSSGAAVVVLRRLEDALAAGDRIYAVIRGAAVNNDGAARSSFSAPSMEGQMEVVSSAIALADVFPESIGYIETHGTGTPLGDPIEFSALTRAFRELGAAATGYCALGSLKANVGHLESAAGVAGLIKAALAVQQAVLPPLLHFRQPNPHLDLTDSPFYVPTEAQPWPAALRPRRAGVSSFGVGGTNAHVVIEQAPAQRPAPVTTTPSRAARPAVVVVSGRTPEARAQSARQLAAALQEQPDFAPQEVAQTLQEGREAFRHRLAVVARDAGECLRGLSEANGARRVAAEAPGAPPTVAFLFPGQGAQRPGMAAGLYENEPVFREVVDTCADLLLPRLGCDVRTHLLAPGSDAAAAEALRQTRLTQPCLFTVELALARLWESWGVRPAALLGHSVGEYVAATVAGVFALPDAIEAVAQRGALVQARPPGAMLAVRAAAADVERRIAGPLAIAAINSPGLCVVAGPEEAVAAFERELASEGNPGRRLVTSHAFHSPMMDAVVEPLAEVIARFSLAAPRLPIASTATGDWLGAADATDPRYWARHARLPVRFADGLGTVLAGGPCILLEVGPGRTLSQLTRQHPGSRTALDVVASLPLLGDAPDGPAELAEAAAHLWVHGVEINWRAREGGAPRRVVSLPGYPFARTPHWVEPPLPAAPGAAAGTAPGSAPTNQPAEKSTAGATTASEANEPLRTRLERELRQVLESVSGTPIEAAAMATDFLDLGLDSLLLTQAATAVRERFGVEVTFRQLLETFNTPAGLAAHLEASLPAAAALTRAGPVPATTPAATAAPEGAAAPVRHGPFRPPEKNAGEPLTALQRSHLDGLIAAYSKRTAGSKHYAAEHRAHFCDPRGVTGFRALWKEIVYPIVCARSKGSHLWDIDGNEYVDITMGFGVNFLGHSPDFVSRAVAAQMERGYEIGPQCPLAGEAAQALCRLTGMERATFCNTGSEAVMAAMRVARTVSGRNRIVFFTGDYHGMFDTVLVRGAMRDGEPVTLPIAPGIPRGLYEDITVLDYGSDAALAWIRAHARELAAVIVEPVQARHPALQPRAFLHELRAVTRESGTALVFDEVITGFRCCPGGAQAWFGIEADLATYGKILGGGLPIGALAGRRRWMDALDGGMWRYGDDSFPEVGVTFFAGTFVRHPLAMAAACASLQFLAEQGPALQDGVNSRMTRLAVELNDMFARRGVQGHVEHFASIFSLDFAPEYKHAGLFFHHLRHRGVHFWEGRVGFLSIAHTESDVDFVRDVFEQCTSAMQAGEFLPASAPLPFADATVPALAAPAPAVAENTPAEGPREVPLTEEQREVWLACQIDPAASASYNESTAVHLQGPVDHAALQHAVRQVVNRHEALRSTFAADGSVQTIAPTLGMEIEEIELPEERDEVLTWQRAECAEPFDLVRGPLVRFRLARRAGGALFVVSAHHLVCDGWSFDTILREIATLYNDAAAGRPFTLTARAPQISGYALAEPARAASAAARNALAYWKRRLQQPPGAPELPLDRPRPARPTFAGDRETLVLPVALTRGLKGLARAQRCTFFTVVFSAFGAFLHRLTGCRDVVVGMPVAGQNQNGCPGLVGHCVKYLPVRQVIDPELDFDEHLRAVSVDLADALEHTQLTLGQLMRELRWPRDPSRPTPLSVGFNLDPAPTQLRFAGLECTLELNPRSHLVGELVFNLADRPDGLALECSFNTDLFTAETIRRWLEHYATLLEALVHTPSCKVAALPLLRPEERQLILETWNPSPRAAPPPRLLHALFERYAIVSPDAIAVEAGGASVTYRELDVRANRLARHLVALGAGPDRCVALLLPRSIEFAEAVLGTLKAGAAFVPVDPSWPEDRLGFIVRDAGARALVTAGRSRPVSLPAATTHVDLHADRQHLDRLPAAPVHLETEPRHLAYVIYTSGSTGEPKGVMIEHRAITAFITAVGRIGAISTRDRALCFTSVSFDPTVESLFAPWSAGATVVMRGEELWTPREFAEVIRQRRVTMVSLPVSYWSDVVRAWAEQPELAPVEQLRLVTVGGEAMPPATLRLWREGGLTAIRVFNAYGPTEATIAASLFECPAEPHPGEMGGRVPIGKPFGPVEAYVLDEHLEPVPIGCPGELHLAGPMLARGYLGRDALTRERFVPHILRPEARMYRTGDRVRFLPDGTLDFLGRVDRQLKIRGYRIEPGEIEGVLAGAAGVLECAVVPVPDAHGISLWAFCVIEGKSGPDEAALLGHLRAQLPAYMVPARVLRVARLDRTTSGKVDTQALLHLAAREASGPAPALPAPPQAAQPGPAEATRPPAPTPPPAVESPALRQDLDDRLRLLWCELLKVNDLTPASDFFASGGHSMLAVRLLTRIEREFGVRLAVRVLFEHPTYGAFAACIQKMVPPPSARPAASENAREPAPAAPVADRAGPPAPGRRDPVDEVEQRLAALWRELLKLDRVAPGTDFFAAGGHSMLAVRLVSLVERQFGARLSVRDVFEEPRLARMARRVYERMPRVAPAHAGPPPATAAGPGGAALFFCATPISSGDDALVAALRRSLAPAQPLVVLAAAAAGAAAAVAEVRRVQPAGPYHLAGAGGGGLLALDLARALEAAGGEVALLALLETPCPAAPELQDAEAKSSALGRLFASALARVRKGPSPAVRTAPVSATPVRATLTLLLPVERAQGEEMRGWSLLTQGQVQLVPLRSPAADGAARTLEAAGQLRTCLAAALRVDPPAGASPVEPTR